MSANGLTASSGVLAESLSRSRQKWTNEGLFEKYWTKPHKRKGVLNEDPKNPPKDSMTKVGTVTITIEPHIIEATMYTVKDPKPKPLPQPNPGQAALPNRPILQYGPPNGAMPPPRTPASAVASPVPEGAQPKTIAPSPTQNHVSGPTDGSDHGQSQRPPAESPRSVAAPSPVVNHANQMASPHYPPRPSSALAAPGPQTMTPSTSAQSPATVVPPPANRAPSNPPPGQLASGSSAKALAPPNTRPQQPINNASMPSPGPQRPATPAQGANTPKSAANDPVIALLAQKASGDPELRDLMKRVAVGQAKEGELAHFQKIIDQLNAEYRRSGGQQGPSADRLLVDGRTVKYFADEVRTILDIVLASNPNQKSADLRPPPRSDPLVVLLVKTALEDQRTKDMIKRIAENRPGYTDATDLKQILDRLHRDMKTAPQNVMPASQGRQQPAASAANGNLPNGSVKPTAGQSLQPGPQALRSKGPPPTPKPDISAVIFDFGTGDRYLFPKYSMLEYLPTQNGHQVVVSFLIVRKGSTSEYGGDPELDYYQPITMRLFTHTGRHLENLARVVAPQDEVRRYMDDVMDNMTRAEYILLAMRLPRMIEDGDKEGPGSHGIEDPKTTGSTPQPDSEMEPVSASNKPSVLWTTSASTLAKDTHQHTRLHEVEDQDQIQYQRLINSVAAKDQQTV